MIPPDVHFLFAADVVFVVVQHIFDNEVARVLVTLAV